MPDKTPSRFGYESFPSVAIPCPVDADRANRKEQGGGDKAPTLGGCKVAEHSDSTDRPAECLGQESNRNRESAQKSLTFSRRGRRVVPLPSAPHVPKGTLGPERRPRWLAALRPVPAGT